MLLVNLLKYDLITEEEYDKFSVSFSKEDRDYLLDKLSSIHSKCTNCFRNLQRKKSLDLKLTSSKNILFLYDYPGVIDNYLGLPMASLADVISSEYAGAFESFTEKSKPALSKDIVANSRIRRSYIYDQDYAGPFYTGGQVFHSLVSDLSLVGQYNIFPVLNCPKYDENYLSVPAKAEERTACFLYAQFKLQLLDPKKIICFGREAELFLKGKHSLSADKLEEGVHTSYVYNCEYLLLKHPSYIALVKDSPDLVNREFQNMKSRIKGFINER